MGKKNRAPRAAVLVKMVAPNESFARVACSSANVYDPEDEGEIFVDPKDVQDCVSAGWKIAERKPAA